MYVVAVIPARFGSTRLTGKPLSDIHGKPMIEWVYENALKARGVDHLYVATDDKRVAEAVQKFKGNAILTPASLPSGTDRVAFVAKEIKADVYINIQGDEPLLKAIAIEKALELVTSGRFSIGTVATSFRDREDIKNPSCVKVLMDEKGKAIYFSRYPIPYSREDIPVSQFICKKHLGLYVYTRDALFEFSNWPPTLLEKAESLEQLRALENGVPIGVAEVDFDSVGVDTPEDLEKVRRILESGARG